MDFKVTNSFSRDNLNYETGSVKNIHYGDIHTRFQTLFDITKEKVPYINKDISIGRILEDFYCKEGDIVLADASEDLNDVGKSIEVFNLNNEKILAGLHTILARPRANYFKKGFLGYLLKSDNVRLQIKKEAQGSKVLSISTGRISKVELTFPILEEQEKITRLLSLIDDRIAVSIKIIQRLETSMRNLRENLLSQKIRFKDSFGESFANWEVKKLGDISIKKSSNISANKIEENLGEYIVYGASGVLKKVDFYEEENDYISIVKDGAGVGRLLYCKGKSSVLGTMDIIKSNFGIDTYFLFCLLSSIDFTKYISGSTIPHIYFKDYKNENCNVPSLEEQNLIINLLRSISNKIEIENQLLREYENQKKYLLQNLFI